MNVLKYFKTRAGPRKLGTGHFPPLPSPPIGGLNDNDSEFDWGGICSTELQDHKKPWRCHYETPLGLELKNLGFPVAKVYLKHCKM